MQHVFGRGEVACRVLVGKAEGRNLLGRLRRRGRIILRWIFRNWDVGVWSESSWIRIGTDFGYV